VDVSSRPAGARGDPAPARQAQRCTSLEPATTGTARAGTALSAALSSRRREESRLSFPPARAGDRISPRSTPRIVMANRALRRGRNSAAVLRFGAPVTAARLGRTSAPRLPFGADAVHPSCFPSVRADCQAACVLQSSSGFVVLRVSAPASGRPGCSRHSPGTATVACILLIGRSLILVVCRAHRRISSWPSRRCMSTTVGRRATTSLLMLLLVLVLAAAARLHRRGGLGTSAVRVGELPSRRLWGPRHRPDLPGLHPSRHSWPSICWDLRSSAGIACRLVGAPSLSGLTAGGATRPGFPTLAHQAGRGQHHLRVGRAAPSIARYTLADPRVPSRP